MTDDRTQPPPGFNLCWESGYPYPQLDVEFGDDDSSHEAEAITAARAFVDRLKAQGYADAIDNVGSFVFGRKTNAPWSMEHSEEDLHKFLEDEVREARAQGAAEERERLAAVLETMPSGLCVWDQVKRGDVVFFFPDSVIRWLRAGGKDPSQ